MLNKKSQNWYSQIQNKPTLGKNRYITTIIADVFVQSKGDNKEEEQNMAETVIRNFLPEDGNGVRINSIEVKPYV